MGIPYFQAGYEHRATQVQNEMARLVIIQGKQVVILIILALVEQNIPDGRST